MYQKHPIVNKALYEINKDIPDNLIGIRGNLYNIDYFNHPGGNTFLEINKGTDITNLFETHHINIKLAEKSLEKCKCVGTYVVKHNYDYNFYDLLRSYVFEKFKTKLSRKINFKTKISLILYIILGGILNFNLLYFKSFSYLYFSICLLNSLNNSILGGFGHNGIHKLEYSSLLLDWNGLSSFEWLLEHVHSHHMYPNSKYDHDSISMIPFLNWIPTKSKSYFSIKGKHIVYLLAEIVVPIQGLFIHKFRWNILKNKKYPLFLRFAPFVFIFRIFIHIYYQGIIFGLITLFINLLLSGYYFAYLAHLNHPYNFKNKNFYKDKIDYVTYQIENTIDLCISNNLSHLFLNLNKQVGHHLFPTLDHCHVLNIYTIFDKLNIKYNTKYFSNLNKHINNILKILSNY